MPDHVFISYSRTDETYARKLAGYLRQQGFDVWIDERIQYGEDWWQSIVEAIRECAAFVVVMTPAADGSKWVQREATLADTLDKPSFPILLQGDLLSSKNWLIYIRTQYVDVRKGQLPNRDFCDRLAQYCKRSEHAVEFSNTGENAPHSGEYEFVRYIDGTVSPLPIDEERVIVLSQGEAFPPVHSGGKGAWWRYSGTTASSHSEYAQDEPSSPIRKEQQHQIHRQPVISSNIQSIGYDPVTQTLEIEFHNGVIYQYHNVPQAIHAEFLGAESHGEYFYQHIKDRYPYTKIR